jgi:hypothetical protein
MTVRIASILVLGGVLLFAPAAPGQDAAELKPFVGKWRTYVAEGGKNTPVEITVQRDGSFSTVLYTQPPRSARGRLEIVDGKFRFRSSDGGAGAVSVAVDSKGKRTLKAVREDNGRSAQYEEVK